MLNSLVDTIANLRGLTEGIFSELAATIIVALLSAMYFFYIGLLRKRSIRAIEQKIEEAFQTAEIDSITDIQALFENLRIRLLSIKEKLNTEKENGLIDSEKYKNGIFFHRRGFLGCYMDDKTGTCEQDCHSVRMVRE